MNCRKCGQALPENAERCENCGTPVPETQDVLAAAFELIDTQRQEPPHESVDIPPETQDAPQNPPAPARNKRLRRGYVLIGVVLLMMLALVVVAVKVIPSGGGKGGIVYLTNLDSGYNLMYLRNADPKTHAAVLTGESAAQVTLTEDGSVLYYTHDDDLCRVDLKKTGNNYTAEKVASDVTYFTVLENGGAVYLTGSGSLYWYDGWDSVMLAGGVNNGYSVDPSETYVTYSVYADRIHTCYRIPLSPGGRREKLIEGYHDILCFDFGRDLIVFVRRENMGYNIYSRTLDGTETLLAENIKNNGSLLHLDVNEGEITIIYMVESTAIRRGYEFASYDICKYENGGSTIVASAVDTVPVYPTPDIGLYGRYTEDGEIEWFQNVNGAESEFPASKGVSFGNRLYVLNGREAVLETYEDNRQVLRSYTIGETELTDPVVLMDGNYNSVYRGRYEGKDVLYYYKEVYEGIPAGDLVRYADGEETVIAMKASVVQILPDSGAVFSISELNGELEGTLSLVKDGESIPIAEDVPFTNVACLGEKQVLYTSNETLYLWDGKNSKKLADDVNKFWVPASARADRETFFYHYLPS